MSRALRVLVADDESRLRELLVRELGRKGHEVEGVGDGEAALARLRERAYDVVILDMKMPRKEGIEVLRELGAFPEHPQVIVMTGFQEVATAVEAMKLGAYDYLTKPTKIEELDIVVRKAAEKGQLLRDNQALRAHAPGAAPFSGIHTKSPRMHEVLRVVERVAPTDSSVLVLGESGTGKELVARAIHERSARAERPFVPIHCGALPRDVLESELFGHEKGAFTGAIASKPGLIDLADGGTLFLDEIGEMEPDSQVKLLRALETGMFFRVGSTRPHAVDVRIVAATNRDLAEALKTGDFRQDLYYRINTITVTLPPLRERPEDVALLAQHFVEANAAYGAALRDRDRKTPHRKRQGPQIGPGGFRERRVRARVRAECPPRGRLGARARHKSRGCRAPGVVPSLLALPWLRQHHRNERGADESSARDRPGRRDDDAYARPRLSEARDRRRLRRQRVRGRRPAARAGGGPRARRR